MKTLSYFTVMLTVLLSAMTAYAGLTPDNVDRLLKQKRDCYQAHHPLMEKPALLTLDACWRAHHHLMK